jgi:hypothetical protein
MLKREVIGLVVFLALIVGGVVAYAFIISSKTSSRVAEYNRLVEEAHSYSYSRPSPAPGWDLVDEDGDQLYRQALTDEECLPSLQDQLAWRDFLLLKQQPDTPLGGKLRDAIEACRPAFDVVERASRAAKLKGPMTVSSEWGEAYLTSTVPIRLAGFMAADARSRRDWRALFSVARMGHDWQRQSTLTDGAVGNVIAQDAILMLRYALERGEVDARNRDLVKAELVYLERTDPGLGGFWFTETMAAFCPEWEKRGGARMPRCGEPIPDDKIPLGTGWYLGSVLSDAWDERFEFAGVQESDWPVRAAWWAEKKREAARSPTPFEKQISGAAKFAKYDGLLAVARSQRSMLLVALGGEVTDPLSGKPFRVSRDQGITLVMSSAMGDDNLLWFFERGRRWVLRVEIPPLPASRARVVPRPAPGILSDVIPTDSPVVQ